MFAWVRSLIRGRRSRRLRDTVDGDLTVDRELDVLGIVNGGITVVAGGMLTLTGICQGSLVVEPGATVTIPGLVMGSVSNRGGKLLLRGTVQGALRTQAGESQVASGARVLGGTEGPVILVCPKCSQRLRVPGGHAELQVTCTACRASWSWVPAGDPQGSNASPESLGPIFDALFGKSDRGGR